MASKPFRVAEPAAKNTNEKKSPVAEPAGKHIVSSLRTGDPLPAASKDVADHEPLIPWPQPATGVDHKPMKLK